MRAGGYPVMLQPRGLRALVVGGGGVAERKVRALLAGGVAVRVVAPECTDGLTRLAGGEVTLVQREFLADDIGDARLVVAATNDAGTNALVAAAAREAGALVNVASDPGGSDFLTPAVYRSGGLVVAVNAGGVPAAAARIRDCIAERLDEGYAVAIEQLAAIRAECLSRGDRERWHEAAAALLGPGFCESVENGSFQSEVITWH